MTVSSLSLSIYIYIYIICEFLTTAKSSLFTVVSMGFTYRKKTEVDHGGCDHIDTYLYMYTHI